MGKVKGRKEEKKVKLKRKIRIINEKIRRKLKNWKVNLSFNEWLESECDDDNQVEN